MRDHLKKNCFSDRVLWHVKTHALEFKTWAPAGGSKSKRSLLPGKPKKNLFTIGGAFLLLFLLMGGFFLHVGAFLLLFSLCGGLFCPYGGLFWVCPPPFTKTSAGAHHSKACLQNLF